MFVDGSANLWTHRDRIQCRADAPEARPLPPRNGGRNGGLLAALEATGCPSQVYHPDCRALGCSECGLSIPPIFRVSGHPADSCVSPLVVLVQCLGQGACWVLGLQKRTPRIPLWPVGLVVSPPGSPALLFLSASTEHLPSTRPCVASSGDADWKEVVGPHLWKNFWPPCRVWRQRRMVGRGCPWASGG